MISAAVVVVVASCPLRAATRAASTAATACDDAAARADSAETAYVRADYATVTQLLAPCSAWRPRQYLLLGWSHYRLDRMADARAAFRAGLAAAPDNLDLLNGEAFASYRLGDAATAEQRFRQILGRNPEREECIRGLAGVLFVSNRFAECLPIFGKLLREHPGDGEAEHRLVKSVDGMLSAWRADGRAPADMVAYGWERAESGDPRIAFEVFRWVLTVDPFHPGARLGLGTLGAQFGQEAAARRALEELLQENPVDARARVALARLHLNAGRKRDADAQVTLLLASHPEDPDGRALRQELDAKPKRTKP
jgi:tetratricopeptide (TPR) repeat protein